MGATAREIVHAGEVAMIPAFVIHQSSNSEREPVVAELERRVPGLARFEAIMHANGVRGCSYSQKGIIQVARDMSLPAVWIMEDDCVFTEHFDLDTWFRDVQAAFEAGISVVCGGSANGQQPRQIPVKNMVEVQAFSSCHCWIARQDAYTAILGLDPDTPIDVAIGTIYERKAVRVPFMATQMPSYSSIQHIHEDYMPLFWEAEKRLLPLLS